MGGRRAIVLAEPKESFSTYGSKSAAGVDTRRGGREVGGERET